MTDLQRTAGSLAFWLHLTIIVKPWELPEWQWVLSEAVSLAVASCHYLPQTASLLICIDRNCWTPNVSRSGREKKQQLSRYGFTSQHARNVPEAVTTLYTRQCWSCMSLLTSIKIGIQCRQLFSRTKHKRYKISSYLLPSITNKKNDWVRFISGSGWQDFSSVFGLSVELVWNSFVVIYVMPALVYKQVYCRPTNVEEDMTSLWSTIVRCGL